MRYSHKYSKLDMVNYTTIRRYKKCNKGDIVRKTYPGGSHDAEVKHVQRMTLAEMSIDFLKADTDLDSREDVYNLFNKFYKRQIDIFREKMYVYYLRKVE